MPEVALVTAATGGIGEDLPRLVAAGGRDLVLLTRSGATVGAQSVRFVPRLVAARIAGTLNAKG